MARRRADWHDLAPYTGCGADEALGMLPLAVGWLRGGMPFATGDAPPAFAARLLAFCRPDHTVCAAPAARPCPICHQTISPYGGAEIRVIGELDIYAAPDLLHHYVTTHHYLPPPEFIAAVMDGPAPTSAEHKALRKALISLARGT
ncbi:MAG: hypothetical protein KC418_07240 [Anaerolineales bacterium]|nr:hypothetical protein [Anaerolineales bacterium]MCB8950564.1 hypothetical protein [Ardenticatenales bacterium]